MAKIISPFVGSAKGKLGGAVYYTRTGGTFARQRVAEVRNPQTRAQMITRVILSTVSKAYSLMQPIADHSFQGKVGAAANHQEFMKINTSRLREGLAFLDNSNYPNNFNPKFLDSMVINNYVISAGKLVKPIVQTWESTEEGFTSNRVGGITVKRRSGETDLAVTYQDVLDFYGLPAGAQLTFITTRPGESRGAVSKINVGRLILAPADGDYTKPLLDNQGNVNVPNEANEGMDNFKLSIMPDQDDTTTLVLVFRSADANWGTSPDNSWGCIFSQYENGGWKRSNSELLFAPDALRIYGIEEALASYEKGTTSSYYLNQSNVNVTED